METLHDDTQSSPVWAIFADLMAALAGILVLTLVWVIGIQLELSLSLEAEKQKRLAEEKRRMALEAALDNPLTHGRVTFQDGRIGISGNVLFAVNSDHLQADGAQLLESLVPVLRDYLSEHDELLMVSGFTDDLPVQRGNARYHDNWGLSAQRALTVMRTLVELGMPADQVFAAAFGAHQPVASNRTDEGRARNRRVELTVVPRAQRDADNGAGDD